MPRTALPGHGVGLGPLDASGGELAPDVDADGGLVVDRPSPQPAASSNVTTTSMIGTAAEKSGMRAGTAGPPEHGHAGSATAVSTTDWVATTWSTPGR